ncbi:MAG TPA: 2,3-bisphosphoglycerate-independent phosphoglycerate mutase [Nitrospiraceae bacterium]|nr:2,3-bisphosphoglycerate-independent phosphoglycerate mutase [Nitrospiraceae bacterium]
MKYLILHADGMADFPCPELGGKTPLQAAVTPNLDRMALGGEVGILALPPDGGHAGSDVTAVAVLGYDPRKYYPGPGPLEAASLGVTVEEHDVVYRCTMVTVRGESVGNKKGGYADVKKLGPQVVVDDATAGLIETEQARELIDAINEQLGSEAIQFYPGSGHRHLMVWVGGKTRAACTDPQRLVGKAIGDGLPSGDGADMLRKIMDAALLILRDHPVNDERQTEGAKPANCIWLWGQGRAPSWPPLPERHQISGAVVSSSDVHRGVGLCAGLDAVEIPPLSDNGSGEFGGRVEVALRELGRKDFVYCHIGLSDDVLHASDPKDKVRAIEEFDARVIGPFLSALTSFTAHRFLMVCDPGLAREGQAIPPILYALIDSAGSIKSRGVSRFNEEDVKAGDAGPRDASKLLARLITKGS